MNKPYINESQKNAQYKDSTEAAIVMPDIYGITDYAKASAEEFIGALHKPVYLLDYFYQLSGEPTNVPPEKAEIAHGLMEKMRGQDFMQIFEQAVADILAANPKVTSFIVVGFCFAGRLAYLTGAESKVKHIVSFYGAGAHAPNFINAQTPVEFLSSKRQGDSSLKVLSFFGTQDPSIPPEDREATKKELITSSIDYTAKEYDAGHAYFQPGRPNYDQAAAAESWQVLKDWLGLEW